MDRDPDERPGNGAGGPGDVDEFDAIVAGWRAEGFVPEWPGPPPRGTNKLWFGEPGSEPPAEQAAEPGTSDEPATPDEQGKDVRPKEIDLRGAGEPSELFVDAGTPPPSPAAVDRDLDRHLDGDHYIPPEPPPLPRLGPPAAVGLGLLLLGLVLVTAPQWVGVPGVYGLPLGLLSLASGLGWLVLRLWPTAPGPGEDDDGAVI